MAKITLSHDDGHNAPMEMEFSNEEEAAKYVHQFVSDSVQEIMYCLHRDGFYRSEEGDDEFVIDVA